MRVFRSQSGKNKQLWHIVEENNSQLENFYYSYCHNAKTAWYDGSRKLQIQQYNELYHGNKLCPSCVGLAYKDHIININLDLKQ